MNRQLRFDLTRPTSYRREEFIVSAANAEAVRMLESGAPWHGGALALVGPKDSGKTHLALAWAERTGAFLINGGDPVDDLAGLSGSAVLLEDAERASAEVLFHLINMAGEPGGALLLTSRALPGAWPAALPDLRSRLNALPVAELGAPDDDILQGVLEKFFRERNIRPTDEVFAYLIRRMERSVPVARELVERLDEAAAAENREISRGLAREVLEDGVPTANLFATSLAKPASSGDKN